ncbi:MAG: NAD-dependent epimerase/dehydratase family protein [Amylibacter sp.]|nr:NAD-dependent epimerase/dehydratase family protein [Amylibacter sp.]
MSRRKKILVTGGSGFIAKHIILQLLNEGFDVRASVRSLDRSAEIVAAMTLHAKNTEDLDKRLTFCELDLCSDVGWEEALQNCQALMHTASPFPLDQPEDESELVRPAADGTLRALTAAHAASVDRVILTSSVVTICNKRLAAGRNRYDETDWSDLHSPLNTAYSKSKIQAEKVAWNFVREHSELKLTTICPSLVLGPPLDGNIGSSLGVVARLMEGRDPMIPNCGIALVDVRDIAQMHVRALQRPESAGNRFIGSERFMWMRDVALVLKAEYPDRQIPIRVAPDWLVRLMSMFDQTIKGILPSLGLEVHLDNSAAAEVLGIEFIEARQAIRTSASSLVRENIIS